MLAHVALHGLDIRRAEGLPELGIVGEKENWMIGTKVAESP